ncbi:MULTISPECIES: hypothetical protein [Actinosynnema]|uniref:hypothetical protein n=1 Tax=Actinosynnema TaxID=40566 RepID=UPI0020A4900A|nr:hypothetical protein [Actinosynnema pretiosum]MCP2096063.1 hypothetical protein [Actinosynnema pretiosum]
MLKKAAALLAAATGLTMIGSPAFADPLVTVLSGATTDVNADADANVGADTKVAGGLCGTSVNLVQVPLPLADAPSSNNCNTGDGGATGESPLDGVTDVLGGLTGILPG